MIGILIISHFRALDWFTPSAMKSRIEIFKEAVHEVSICDQLKKVYNEKLPKFEDAAKILYQEFVGRDWCGTASIHKCKIGSF